MKKTTNSKGFSVKVAVATLLAICSLTAPSAMAQEQEERRAGLDNAVKGIGSIFASGSTLLRDSTPANGGGNGGAATFNPPDSGSGGVGGGVPPTTTPPPNNNEQFCSADQEAQGCRTQQVCTPNPDECTPGGFLRPPRCTPVPDTCVSECDCSSSQPPVSTPNGAPIPVDPRPQSSISEFARWNTRGVSIGTFTATPNVVSQPDSVVVLEWHDVHNANACYIYQQVNDLVTPLTDSSGLRRLKAGGRLSVSVSEPTLFTIACDDTPDHAQLRNMNASRYLHTTRQATVAYRYDPPPATPVEPVVDSATNTFFVEHRATHGERTARVETRTQYQACLFYASAVFVRGNVIHDVKSLLDRYNYRGNIILQFSAQTSDPFNVYGFSTNYNNGPSSGAIRVNGITDNDELTYNFGTHCELEEFNIPIDGRSGDTSILQNAAYADHDFNLGYFRDSFYAGSRSDANIPVIMSSPFTSDNYFESQSSINEFSSETYYYVDSTTVILNWSGLSKLNNCKITGVGVNGGSYESPEALSGVAGSFAFGINQTTDFTLSCEPHPPVFNREANSNFFAQPRSRTIRVVHGPSGSTSPNPNPTPSPTPTPTPPPSGGGGGLCGLFGNC